MKTHETKQSQNKSGAGQYGKAGAGFTGHGLSGSGLSKQDSGSGSSGSGMRKRYPAVVRPAVMPQYGEDGILPELGKRYSNFQGRFSDVVENGGRNVIKPYPNHMPRSQEAKDYMVSIRNNKQVLKK